MYRVLTALFLVFIFISESHGQRFQPYPLLKNGQLNAEASLMHHKINHTAWRACRFGDRYFFILQLNQIAGADQKAALTRRGITLEHWLSGNNYLATCRTGSDLSHPESTGIADIFALPPGLKLDNRLRDNSDFQNGPLDFIVVSCFPGDAKQMIRDGPDRAMNSRSVFDQAATSASYNGPCALLPPRWPFPRITSARMKF